MKLKGRTVLVTGAAKRIGKAIALAFARQGCHLILHYRNAENEIKETQKEIEAFGVQAHIVQANLSDEKSITELLTRENKVLKNVTVLINSASIFYPTPLEAIQIQHWNDILRTNLIGPFMLARHLGIRLNKESLEGVVINITDTSASRPFKHYLPYSASKAALENVTRSLAKELAPYVRVNSIAPGTVLFPTDYTKEQCDLLIKQIPMKREGKPEDISSACIFLTEADYIDGITLTVDGGKSLV